MKCELCNSGIGWWHKEAKYALFQLRDDFTKKWIQVCSEHDDQVALNNGTLLALFPDKTWTEVK